MCNIIQPLKELSIDSCLSMDESRKHREKKRATYFMTPFM